MTDAPPPPPPVDHDPPWPEDPPYRHDAGDPDEAFPVPFRVGDAFAMIAWTIVAQVLVIALAALTGVVSSEADVTDDPVTALSIQIVAQVVTLMGIIVWLRLRGVLSWRVWGPLRPRGRHVAMGVGLGVVALVLVLTVSQLVDSAFGPFEAPEQFALQVSSAGGITLALAAVSAVLLAPVVEEVVFRSLLFQSVRGRLGLIAALVIQALVFAYVHLEVVGNPPAMVGLIVLAIWLAATFHRTGTLVVPITVHATYNALVLLFQLVVTSTPAPT